MQVITQTEKEVHKLLKHDKLKNTRQLSILHAIQQLDISNL